MNQRITTSTFQQKMHFIQELIFLPPFSLLSLLLLLIFLHKWISPNSTTNIKHPPPSPPRLPIIGNLHQLGTYPYRTLQTLSQKYGDLIFLQLGSKPAIVVSSAELASQVLKTHDVAFANRPNLSVFRRLLANGKDILSSNYGEYWRQLRSICVLQLLSTKRVRSFRRVREEELDLMMSNIKGMSMVNLSEMFLSLSTDVICRVAFGKKYGGDESGIGFYELVKEFSKLLGGYYVGDFIPWLAWIDSINGVDAKVSRLNSGFDEFFNRILEEHSIRRGDGNGNGEERETEMRDFVDVLLEAQRDDGSRSFRLEKENIKGLIKDMFVAGSDTSYIVLEWMMSELLRNPRVMQELQAEVRGIAGDREAVTEDDVESMKYLKAVIKETLRLHPPAPLMAPHESSQDVALKGYHIAAGTLVLINVWAIGRDPAYWDEPESFNPERFLDSPIDFKGHDFEFIPFGSGRRICPGMAFATTNIELVLANLVNRFDWALSNGESLDMREAPGISVHRKTPLVAIPTPRI